MTEILVRLLHENEACLLIFYINNKPVKYVEDKRWELRARDNDLITAIFESLDIKEDETT